ncbi:hypothetical protein OIU76_025030 [Salix suchowensis]|nr:hypothetical protein OIU76_025030 [Salix suchowensis]
MVPEFGGSSLLLGLPDDVFAIISRSLSPRDMCTLSLCCRSLYGLVASEKVWLTQCDNVGIISHQDIMEWRKGVASYRAMCRFLELGPLGIEEGPILWAPVFEIIDKELARKLSRSHYGLSRSQRLIIQCEPKLPFSSLPFTDRRKLIDVVTSEGFNWKEAPEVASDPTRLQWSEIRRILDWSSGSLNGDDNQMQSNTKKSLGGYFRAYIRGIWGKSSSINGSHAHSKHSSSSRQSKHAQLLEFLGSGDTIGLSLHASKMKLSSYRAWPNMHDSQFALYKLPMRAPRADQEYAGLWGGTFGWPPREPH